MKNPRIEDPVSITDLLRYRIQTGQWGKARGLGFIAKKLYETSQDTDHGEYDKANSKCHGVAHDETKTDATHYQHGLNHYEYSDCPIHQSLPSVKAGFILLLLVEFGKIDDAQESVKPYNPIIGE